MDKNKMERVLRGDMGMNEEELIAFLQQNLSLVGSIMDNGYSYHGNQKSLNIALYIRGNYITQMNVPLPNVGYN
jgi:hypothetical protein